MEHAWPWSGTKCCRVSGYTGRPSRSDSSNCPVLRLEYFCLSLQTIASTLNLLVPIRQIPDFAIRLFCPNPSSSPLSPLDYFALTLQILRFYGSTEKFGILMFRVCSPGLVHWLKYEGILFAGCCAAKGRVGICP